MFFCVAFNVKILVCTFAMKQLYTLYVFVKSTTSTIHSNSSMSKGDMFCQRSTSFILGMLVWKSDFDNDSNCIFDFCGSAWKCRSSILNQMSLLCLGQYAGQCWHIWGQLILFSNEECIGLIGIASNKLIFTLPVLGYNNTCWCNIMDSVEDGASPPRRVLLWSHYHKDQNNLKIPLW